jgi:hypothetical protein
MAGGLVQFQRRQPLADRHPLSKAWDPAQTRLRTRGPARIAARTPTRDPHHWLGGRALRGRGAAEEGSWRAGRPSRWTLPITAFRVTFPSSAAIWLAGQVPEFLQLLDAIVSQVNTVMGLFPSRRTGQRRDNAVMPNLSKSLRAESLSPRRGAASAPERVRRTAGLRRSELPHEMSYPTGERLQYGVTLAQESACVRPHVPSFKHCNWIFPRHRKVNGAACQAPCRLTLVAVRIECCHVPPRKGGTFCFSGLGC